MVKRLGHDEPHLWAGGGGRQEHEITAIPKLLQMLEIAGLW